MFEQPPSIVFDEEPPWLVDEDPLGEPTLPPVPADLLDEPDSLLVQQELAVDSWLAGLSPEDRFEHEFGRPATPEDGYAPPSPSMEAAAYQQDLAVQAHRMRTVADAHRVRALLAAYETSIADLSARFGPGVGSGDGLGGQAFCRSMGLLTGTHPNQVAHEVAVARTLRDRLPLTWAVFLAGQASWVRVGKAVQQADGLDDEHWAAYDRKAASIVATSSRVKDDLRKQRERLQDGTAAKRARTTHERRRTSVELGSDSGVAFVAEGLATDWMPVNDALHRAAVAAHGVDGETRSVAQLRHDIALDLLTEGLRRTGQAAQGLRVPRRKAVDVRLILTVPALAWLGRTKEQAILAGYGPIAMEVAKGLAGAATSFVRVLTDPVTGVRLTMDRTMRTPPADLARWVMIRDGRSRFPGVDRPAHLCDIDHAREWHDGGPTDEDNLITLDRPSHNAKSAGLYDESLLDSGVVGWNDAWGHRFEDPPNDPLDPVPSDLLLHRPPPDDDPCPF